MLCEIEVIAPSKSAKSFLPRDLFVPACCDGAQAKDEVSLIFNVVHVKPFLVWIVYKEMIPGIALRLSCLWLARKLEGLLC